MEELAEPPKQNGQLDELINRVRSYNPHADEGLIRRAYDYSDRMHHGQKRMSGEPYVIHPLNVSLIIAQLKLDVPSIVTGLLHDIVEDTNVPLTEIQNLFGPEVSSLVDGVTKVSKITFQSREEKQAENFRKMIIAMAQDIRVILIKLADRLHNMRTLDHLAPDRQIEILARDPGNLRPARPSDGYRLAQVGTGRRRAALPGPGRLPDAQGVRRQDPGGARGVHRGGHRDPRPAAGGIRGSRPASPDGPSISTRSTPRCRTRSWPSKRSTTWWRSASSSTRCANATRRWAWCTATGNRCRAASRTTSRCPRPTCTSRCTPR